MAESEVEGDDVVPMPIALNRDIFDPALPVDRPASPTAGASTSGPSDKLMKLPASSTDVACLGVAFSNETSENVSGGRTADFGVAGSAKGSSLSIVAILRVLTGESRETDELTWASDFSGELFIDLAGALDAEGGRERKEELGLV